MSLYGNVFKIGFTVVGGTMKAGCEVFGAVRQATATDPEEALARRKAWTETGNTILKGAQTTGQKIGDSVAVVVIASGKAGSAVGSGIATALGADERTVRNVSKVCEVCSRAGTAMLIGDIVVAPVLGVAALITEGVEIIGAGLDGAVSLSDSSDAAISFVKPIICVAASADAAVAEINKNISN